jgi:DNA-binding NtrC family response regulator
MKRILVIDDDPSVRLLYQEELLEEGYDVISSDGGKGVFQLIADERPDLLLLDLNLGNRSGLDLLQDIRKKSWTVPVILLTASPAVKFEPSPSVHACVTKNSDMTGLKRQIAKCFNPPDCLPGGETKAGQESRESSAKPGIQLDLRFNE